MIRYINCMTVHNLTWWGVSPFTTPNFTKLLVKILISLLRNCLVNYFNYAEHEVCKLNCSNFFLSPPKVDEKFSTTLNAIISCLITFDERESISIYLNSNWSWVTQRVNKMINSLNMLLNRVVMAVICSA